MITFGCGCREISRTPIEFKIESCPQVHINCGPLLPNTNDKDFDTLQRKIVCDFKKVIKLLECGILPDIEIILEEISLLFMNGCGYNVAKKMYSTDIEDDYFLRHDNFLSEFDTLEEKNQVLLNLGIYDKLQNMISKQEVNTIIDNTTTEINTEISNIVEEINKNLDTKIGFVVHIGKYYYGFATAVHYGLWLENLNDDLVIGKWIAGNYIPTEFTIVFNTGEEADLLNPITVIEGFSFIFPNPTWSNDPTQHFVGWYLNSSFLGEYYNAGDRIVPTFGMVFYAKWVRDPRTITFYANNGTSNSIVINCYYMDRVKLTNQGIIIGDRSEQVQVSYTGYHFINWNTTLTGSGTSYNTNDEWTVDDNLVLYALWEINEYTVTFNSNYGSNPTLLQVIVNYNTLVNSLTFPNFVRNDGYIIKGWSTNSETITNLPTKITNDITFYTIWLLGYAYKLIGSNTVLSFTEEPNWNFSSGQLITLKELSGWNDWKDKTYQYLIFPNKISLENIEDYFIHNDDTGLSLLNNYSLDSSIESAIIFKRKTRYPFGDLNKDDTVKILQVIN